MYVYKLGYPKGQDPITYKAVTKDAWFSLPETIMEVENRPLEDHIPLQTGGFPLR